MKKIIKWLLLKFGVRLLAVREDIEGATLPRFGNRPVNLKISLPRNIAGAERILIGDQVNFGPGCFLIAMANYPDAKMASPDYPLPPQIFHSSIAIGNRVTATAGLQIFAQDSVTIEDDVMFASNVFINDGSHGYQNGNLPYKYQPITQIAPITIKRGCWLGQNVVVMPGVTIGELSIIGSNSVVKDSIPPRSIAVGSPAQVIKQWDSQSGRWEAVKIAKGPIIKNE